MFIPQDPKRAFHLITENLQKVYSLEEAESISRILFENINISRIQFLSGKVDALSSEQMNFLQNATTRLLNHEPIQYILGHTYFYGLKLKVGPGVLIPRQETEELVDLIKKSIKHSHPRILDIGTGSGCIALSLKNEIPESQVFAIDNSKEVIDIAVENAQSLDLNVHFYQLDVLKEAVLPGRFDVVVSNPPYVRDSEKDKMQKNVLEYEPHQALFVSDEQPLLYYECIIELSARHLDPGGYLFFEINENFGAEVMTLLKETGFKNVTIVKDLNGKDRIAIGEWYFRT